MKKMLKVLLSALFVVAICGCKKKEEAAPKKAGDDKPAVEKPAGGEEKPDAGGEEAPEEGS